MGGYSYSSKGSAVMYQTASPVGRRRTKNAERQAEIMRQHWNQMGIKPMREAVDEALAPIAQPSVEDSVRAAEEICKPKRGRKAKAK
jgi:hypothetical protein